MTSNGATWLNPRDHTSQAIDNTTVVALSKDQTLNLWSFFYARGAAMCLKDLIDALRQDGLEVTEGQIRWAISSGRITRPPLDGSLRFNFDGSHLSQLRAGGNDMNLNLPNASPYTLQSIADANGKHISTVCRWVTQGVCGVRLEAYRVGGRRYVQRRALEDFDRALNSTTLQATGVHGADSVDEELDAEGL